MTNSSDDMISTLSKSIIQAADEIVNDADFDKSTIGTVVGKSGSYYSVLAFGSTYSIKSSQTFAVNDRVVVTACQNDFKKLVIRPV